MTGLLLISLVALIPSVLTVFIGLAPAYALMILPWTILMLKSRDLLFWNALKPEKIWPFCLTYTVISALFIWNFLIADTPFFLRSLTEPYSTWGLFGVLVFGVIAEEVWFRGALWDLLAGRPWNSEKKQLLCLFLTSVLFGLHHFGYWDWEIHSKSIFQALGTAVAGLVFGFIRMRTGNTRWSILVHQWFNIIGIMIWSIGKN